MLKQGRVFLKKQGHFILLIIGVILPVTLQAQVGNSPYSRQGIGLPVDQTLIHHDAMGGVGISNPENFHLNLKNPALLYVNSLALFEGAAGGEYKTMRSAENSGKFKTAELNYLAFSFPGVANYWSFSMGLMPFSNVGYESSTTRLLDVTGQPVNVSVKGSGGFNQVYLANGVRITKNFAVGIKAQYLFGAIMEDNTHELSAEDGNLGFKGTYHQRLNPSDFAFGGGLHYRIPFNNNTFLNVGATYDLNSKIDTERLTTLQRRDNIDSNLSKVIADESGSITLPEKFGIGLSYQKAPGFTLGSDFSIQKWSAFKNFNGSNEGMQDSYEMALGGKWIPDPSSVDNYFNRVTYRFGMNYKQTPFTIETQSIDDFSLSAGFGFPVGELSYFNLTMQYGTRGNTQNNLIQENYFGIKLGVSYNDRWFVQPKYQ